MDSILTVQDYKDLLQSGREMWFSTYKIIASNGKSFTTIFSFIPEKIYIYAKLDQSLKVCKKLSRMNLFLNIWNFLNKAVWGIKI